MYKIGDRVVIQSEIDPFDSNWCSPDMDRWLGKVLTIDRVYEQTTSRGYFIPKEEPNFAFMFFNIVGFEDPELEKKRIAEEEEKERKLAEKYKDMIFKGEDVLKIAESIFGEERVELKKKSDKSFSIIIYFPEVEISNKEGRSHKIKDLFVEIRVKDIYLEGGFKANIYINGLRTTFTLKELNSNYSHSHLHTSYMGTFVNFCLGSDFLSTLISNLRMDLSEDSWYMLFYSLDNYLKWESVDTVPYIFMKSIKYGKSVETKDITLELGRIIEESPIEMWGFTDGLEVIAQHPSFQEFFDARSKIRKMSAYVPKDIDKVAEKLKQDKLPHSSFIFKGKSIPYIVINDVLGEKNNEHISGDILGEYNSIINNNLKGFSKKLEYERRKAEAREIRIGE